MSHLTEQEFSSLEISEKTVKAITEMGFTHLTKIQAEAIPHLLNLRSVIACAKTGSGKTLAFLIPVIEYMSKLKAKPRNGTCVIIISPTRELAMQTYDVLKQLMKYHSQRHGLVIGGAKRKEEAEKLYWGVTIVVGTPGRLLDHLQNTEGFHFGNFLCLVIDEVDRLLDIGFEEQVKQILRILPNKEFRLTMMFSATMSQKAEELAKIAVQFGPKPLYIGVEEWKKSLATPEGLKQGFWISRSEERFVMLYSYLRRNRDEKLMVFFSSRASVQFHHDLFNYTTLACTCIHGQQDIKQRMRTLRKFRKAERGILLCTDIAARGLDIPKVDCVIQYDPPYSVDEYIHRVGRTARGECQTGEAILFLRPEEMAFTSCLLKKVSLIHYTFLWDAAFDVQGPLERLVRTNDHFRPLARLALKAYVRAYKSHQRKDIFNTESLDIVLAAKAFGLTVPRSFHVK